MHFISVISVAFRPCNHSSIDSPYFALRLIFVRSSFSLYSNRATSFVLVFFVAFVLFIFALSRPLPQSIHINANPYRVTNYSNEFAFHLYTELAIQILPHHQ